MRRLGLWVAFLLVESGCSSSPGGRAEGEREEMVDRVLAYSPLVSQSQRRHVGESCDGEIGSCSTGLCLHVSALPSAGYVCSKACDEDADCPEQFRCVVLHGIPIRVCVPPRGWQGQPAGARAARVARAGVDAGTSRIQPDGAGNPTASTATRDGGVR